MKLVQCCMCCTSGDYKVLLDMEEETINALEEKAIGDGLRTLTENSFCLGCWQITRTFLEMSRYKPKITAGSILSCRQVILGSNTGIQAKS